MIGSTLKNIVDEKDSCNKEIVVLNCIPRIYEEDFGVAKDKFLDEMVANSVVISDVNVCYMLHDSYTNTVCRVAVFSYADKLYLYPECLGYMLVKDNTNEVESNNIVNQLKMGYINTITGSFKSYKLSSTGQDHGDNGGAKTKKSDKSVTRYAEYSFITSSGKFTKVRAHDIHWLLFNKFDRDKVPSSNFHVNHIRESMTNNYFKDRHLNCLSNLECVCMFVNKRLGIKTKAMKKAGLVPEMRAKQLTVTKQEACKALGLDNDKVFVGFDGDLQEVGSKDLILEHRYLCRVVYVSKRELIKSK